MILQSLHDPGLWRTSSQTLFYNSLTHLKYWCFRKYKKYPIKYRSRERLHIARVFCQIAKIKHVWFWRSGRRPVCKQWIWPFTHNDRFANRYEHRVCIPVCKPIVMCKRPIMILNQRRLMRLLLTSEFLGMEKLISFLLIHYPQTTENKKLTSTVTLFFLTSWMSSTLSGRWLCHHARQYSVTPRKSVCKSTGSRRDNQKQLKKVTIETVWKSVARENKNLAIANRSRVSCAHNTSRASIGTITHDLEI